MSKKVTLSADGTTATVVDATMTDVVGTLITSDSAVTGMYKYAQLALVGFAGMAFANKKHTGEFMNFGSKQAFN